MKKLFLLICCFCAISLLNAQQVEAEKAASKTTFVNQAGNWFLGIQGGAAHLFSETSDRVDFFDNIQPTVGLSVGKWMSPVWGLRLNMTGAKLQGYTNGFNGSTWYVGDNYTSAFNTNNTYLKLDDANRGDIQQTFWGKEKTDKHGVNGYWYDVPYVSGSIDMLLNVNNLFAKYNEDRVFNFILFGGLGYAHTLKSDKGLGRTAVNNIMGKGGFIADFSVSSAVSINLEGQALILPEIFDRQAEGANNHDMVANLMLGLTYKFNPRGFEQAILYDPDEISRLNRQVNQLMEENNELNSRPEFCPDCPDCPQCPEVIIKQEGKKIDYLPSPVFFRIGSSAIDNAQWKSIEDAVKYLRDNPNARLRITGYADRATGTPAGNRKLSEARAKAVYNAMVNRYYVSPSRITTDYLGDEIQPFAENEWNRVVVFVKN